MSVLQDIKIPDIGDFKDVVVSEVKVKPGDTIDENDTVLILETDKATVDIPASHAGKVTAVKVSVGDRVSQGSSIFTLEYLEIGASQTALTQALSPPAESLELAAPSPAISPPVISQTPHLLTQVPSSGVRAGPSVRRIARELGVDLRAVRGSGLRRRITRQDVSQFVSTQLASAAPRSSNSGLDLLPWPRVDFARYGVIERVSLSKIRRISGANLTRNAVLIPHVTNFDEADITELEAFRLQINQERAGAAKITLLAFVIRAVVAVLQKYPTFNSSLDGDELILKRHFHIGFAVDTPDGLVVPNIKDADKKGVAQLATEAATIAAEARAGRLKMADMQGTTFTVSSLGGVGGTGFTPIINAPEVAILGLARAQTKPVWDGQAFRPRYLQPMSLSWDHRVVDGVAAARFLGFLSALLADFRRVAM